jgi:hypothetical protein
MFKIKAGWIESIHPALFSKNQIIMLIEVLQIKRII